MKFVALFQVSHMLPQLGILWEYSPLVIIIVKLLMNARKLQSKLSMQIQDTVRASEMVLYCVTDHNILRTEGKRITK
jgi:hypothetical protein